MSKHSIWIVVALILGGIIFYEWRKKMTSAHSTVTSQAADLSSSDGFKSENQYSYD